MLRILSRTSVLPFVSSASRVWTTRAFCSASPFSATAEALSLSSSSSLTPSLPGGAVQSRSLSSSAAGPVTPKLSPPYSLNADGEIVVGAMLPQIDSSKLTVTKTTTPRTMPPKETLKFGQTYSDHILEVNWDAKDGWASPRIIPYGPFSIEPAASVFHYALEAFEGMKAYVDEKDDIRIFRPDKNMARLNKSARRLLLPSFDGVQVMKCIEELLRIDKAWIPRGWGYSLYIRPTLISTHQTVGVAPPAAAKLFVVLSPVGPYYPEGFKPVSVYAEDKYARAWPGGVGDAKVGGNYAISILPALSATMKGYSQILWLNGTQVTEVGTMNIFFFWKRADGKKELITAPLDGTILPGVTRDSILALSRQWKEFEVSERPFTIDDVITAVKEGRMIEAFGAGTAAIVSPVKCVAYKGVDYQIPLNANDPKAQIGALTQRFSDTLMGIQYGKIPHQWSQVVPSRK